MDINQHTKYKCKPQHYKHLFPTHFLIELHGLVGATIPDAVPALGQHPHAAAQPLRPPGHTEHAQTQRPTLSCFDHGCCRFVMLHWDAVDLHDVVPGLEAVATSRTAGHAVVHHQRAVSNDGEAKAAIRAGSDVNLRKVGKNMDAISLLFSSEFHVCFFVFPHQ